jgi:hypothetical protein
MNNIKTFKEWIELQEAVMSQYENQPIEIRQDQVEVIKNYISLVDQIGAQNPQLQQMLQIIKDSANALMQNPTYGTLDTLMGHVNSLFRRRANLPSELVSSTKKMNNYLGQWDASIGQQQPAEPTQYTRMQTARPTGPQSLLRRRG